MTKEETHISNTYFPLEGLLTHLREAEFTVTPQHYHEVNVLLNTLVSEYEFEELGSLLCPIFARSREQQVRFYEVFQEFFSKIINQNRNIKKASNFKEKTEQEAAVSQKKFWFDNDILRGTGLALGLITYLLLVFWIFGMISKWLPTTILQTYVNNPPGFVIIFHICLGVLLFLFYQIRKYYKKFQKKPAKNKKSFSKSPPFTFRPKINLPSLNLLPKNEALHLNHALVSQADDYINTGIPDIHKTLQKTVENAGLVEIQYQRYRSKPRYLLLIDTSQSNKHQAEWFDYIAYILQDSDTTVEKYFFDQDPRYVRAKKGDKEISLTNIYNAQRLLILTDGGEFMDTISGGMYIWVEDLFNIWDERAVLTNRPIEDWDGTEECLSAEFEIAPATIDGLLSVIDDFDNRQDNRLEDWRKNDDLDYLGTDEVSILQSFLPQEVFFWLCSCAVFPRLYWDLTLYLGMDAETSSNQLLNSKYLSLLNRLKWFREGKIPAEKRAELIKFLPADRLVSTRRALVKILRDKRSIPPFDSYAFEEYQVFLLHIEYELEEDFVEKKRIYQDLENLVEETGEDSAEILDFLEDNKGVLDIQEEGASSRKLGVFDIIRRGVKSKISTSENEDELTWVSYRNPDKPVRIKSGVKDKVADSKNIILLVHGLLAGTDLMTLAFRKQIENEKYDTILAFDYESAVTSLSESAVILQRKLAEVGISKEGKKRITIVSENSGAIVTRWLIEQLDGASFTDKLILLGPANGGMKFADFYQRFGRIVSLIPFVTNISFNLISVIKQLTTDGEIITKLNASPDPHVPYFIIHGSLKEMVLAEKKVSRLIRIIGDAVIREDSDGEIGITSAKSVGNGERPVADEEAMNSKVGAEGIFGDRRPMPHYYQVACMLREYFKTEESLSRLDALLEEEVNELEDASQEEAFSIDDFPNILESEESTINVQQSSVSTGESLEIEDLDALLDEEINEVEEVSEEQDLSVEDVPNVLENKGSNINVQQSSVFTEESLEVEDLGNKEPISLLDQIYRHNIIGTSEAKEDMVKDLVEYLKVTKEKETLQDLDFSQVKIEGINFNTPHFVNCNFTQTEWQRILIIRANTKKSNFKNAIISDTDVIDSDFFDSNFTGTIFRKNMMNRNSFKNSVFQEFEMAGCDFYFGEMELDKLTNSLINECNFSNVTIESCQFVDCRIIGSDFIEAEISLTEFDNCKFSDVKFDYANFDNVVFRRMDLRAIDFSKAKFNKVQMIDCQLSRKALGGYSKLSLEIINNSGDKSA
ncbi:MAG: hypothetical protein ACI85O_001264 [Saprospiraceae bacterium]